jgi:Na+-transporting methylmalonyl-CoA/oxaloacetate decarboxylase gamma subunit
MLLQLLLLLLLLLLICVVNCVAVSMGQLIKEAMAQDTKAGMAARPYVEKDMMS